MTHTDPHIETSSKLSRLSHALTVFILTIATLSFGKAVFIPLTLALFLAFLLAPLVKKLSRFHIGRLPATLLGMCVALGIILAIGGIIGTQIAQLSTNLSEYSSTVKKKIAIVRGSTLDRFTNFAGAAGVQSSGSGESAVAPTDAKAPSSGGDISAGAVSQGPPPSPLELAQRYLSLVLSPIGTFGIVFVVAFFALLEQESLRDRLVKLLGSDEGMKATLEDAGKRLSRYFLTQLCINTVFGIVIGIGLLIIGVPNPILFGIISALLRFVPYIGSIISAILPLGLAVAVDPGWSLALWTGCLYIVVEVTTGQFLEPMIYGHSTGLSPFSVIVAALFWSWLWGPVGLLLSTPLSLCLVVAGRHSKPLAFLDTLLGDNVGEKRKTAEAKSHKRKR